MRAAINPLGFIAALGPSAPTSRHLRLPEPGPRCSCGARRLTPQPLPWAAAAVRLRKPPGRPRKHPLEPGTRPGEGRAPEPGPVTPRRSVAKRMPLADATANATQNGHGSETVAPRLLSVADAGRYLGIGV